MRCFTGDEAGLVKCVDIPEGQANATKRTKVGEVSAVAEIKVFGKVVKDTGVQKMAWGSIDGNKKIVVARKSGVIQFMTPETGEIVREYKQHDMGKSSFVGLYANESHLYACTSAGDLSMTKLSDEKSLQPLATLPSNLHIMRVHPTSISTMAIGGKECDLQLYDVNQLSTSTDPLFDAQNVDNDFLGLRQSVWIRDLQFLNPSATKIATATHYGQVRLYDTKAGRKPVMNVSIGKTPLTSLSIGTDMNHVIYTDTKCTAALMDIRKGNTVGSFKGFSGAATAVQVVPPTTFSSPSAKPKVVSVSVDRHLRVHDAENKTRRLEHKIYLKQLLTSVLVDDSYVSPPSKEEEEEEAMWDTMEKAQDSNKRKR